MTEVGQRFTTRTEERLLAVVYTLQQRTYKTGLPASAAVPEVFKKELTGGRWLGCSLHVQGQGTQSNCHAGSEACLNLLIELPCLQACVRPAAAVTWRPLVLASSPTTSSSLPGTWTRRRQQRRRLSVK